MEVTPVVSRDARTASRQLPWKPRPRAAWRRQNKPSNTVGLVQWMQAILIISCYPIWDSSCRFRSEEQRALVVLPEPRQCYTEKATPARHRPERQHNARSNHRKQCSHNETNPYSNPTPPRQCTDLLVDLTICGCESLAGLTEAMSSDAVMQI